MASQALAKNGAIVYSTKQQTQTAYDNPSKICASQRAVSARSTSGARQPLSLGGRHLA